MAARKEALLNDTLALDKNKALFDIKSVGLTATEATPRFYRLCLRDLQHLFRGEAAGETCTEACASLFGDRCVRKATGVSNERRGRITSISTNGVQLRFCVTLEEEEANAQFREAQSVAISGTTRDRDVMKSATDSEVVQRVAAGVQRARSSCDGGVDGRSCIFFGGVDIGKSTAVQLVILKVPFGDHSADTGAPRRALDVKEATEAMRWRLTTASVNAAARRDAYRRFRGEKAGTRRVGIPINEMHGELAKLAPFASSEREVCAFHAAREVYAPHLFAFESNTELLSIKEANRNARQRFIESEFARIRDELEKRDVPTTLLVAVGNGGDGQGLRGSDTGAVGCQRAVRLMRAAGMPGAVPVSERHTSRVCVACNEVIQSCGSSARVVAAPNVQCIREALQRVLEENVQHLQAISNSRDEVEKKRATEALKLQLVKRLKNLSAHGKWSSMKELEEKLRDMPELATAWHRKCNRKLHRKWREQQRRTLSQLRDRHAELEELVSSPATGEEDVLAAERKSVREVLERRLAAAAADAAATRAPGHAADGGGGAGAGDESGGRGSGEESDCDTRNVGATASGGDGGAELCGDGGGELCGDSGAELCGDDALARPGALTQWADECYFHKRCNRCGASGNRDVWGAIATAMLTLTRAGFAPVEEWMHLSVTEKKSIEKKIGDVARWHWSRPTGGGAGGVGERSLGGEGGGGGGGRGGGRGRGVSGGDGNGTDG